MPTIAVLNTLKIYQHSNKVEQFTVSYITLGFELFQTSDNAVTSWLTSYFENKAITLDQLKTLMTSKYKKRRDAIAHQPDPKKVSAALQSISSSGDDALLPLLRQVFQFVHNRSPDT